MLVLDKPKTHNSDRVRAILDEAAKAGKPVWISVGLDDVEKTKRLPAYMLKIDNGHYANENWLRWDNSGPGLFNTAFLAPHLFTAALGCWPLTYPLDVRRYEGVAMVPGALRMTPDLFELAQK